MDKALSVGINTYPGAQLAGCVNDTANIANFVVQRHRFKNKDIRLLVDERATTKNILKALEWLVSDLNAGDRCLFHFSGHGIQVATKNWKQEVDGLDEAICPYDFRWTDRRMIRDKQLYKIFRKIPAGVKFNWINDSCHSGDLTREMTKNAEYPKTIPLPLDIAWDIGVARADNACCVGMSPANEVMDVHSRTIENGLLDVGFVSGCRSNQTSADTSVNGIPCGALTWYLVETMKKLPKRTPLDKIVKETRNRLASLGYSQRPQAEGARKSKPFLG